MSTRRGISGRPALRRLVTAVAVVTFALGLWIVTTSFSSDRLPLRVDLGSRSISKLPFLIAADQGLYEKYGVDVDLRMPAPDFGGGRGERRLITRVLDELLQRSQRRDLYSNGATPDVVEMVTNLAAPRTRMLASTDCTLRSHFVARHGITSLEELKGKRIGVTGLIHNITGFAVLELAARMGWDPTHDISIVLNGDQVRLLRDGRVDAIVAQERDYAEALEAGYPVLADTRSWGDLPVGGNSVQAEESWLKDANNQEAARRFLKALVEAVAIFHEDRELALDVLQRWNGVSRRYAEVMYDEAAIPRKPFPCYEGIRRTMEVYDSHAMRGHVPEEFYDDGILRELDQSGFIDGVYAEVRQSRPPR